MQTFLDVVSSCRKGGFFVDLFVRVSNQVAVNMYKRLGYSVYRTVIEYYSASNGEPDEDAYGEPAKLVILWFWVSGRQMNMCCSSVKVLIEPHSFPAFLRESGWWCCSGIAAEFAILVADMRKALSRDTEKKSIIPLPHPVRPEDIE